jgi:hypothetical protein
VVQRVRIAAVPGCEQPVDVPPALDRHVLVILPEKTRVPGVLFPAG